MSTTPHSAADLDLINQVRFAGLDKYRLAVWRVLVDDEFPAGLPPIPQYWTLGAAIASS